MVSSVMITTTLAAEYNYSSKKIDFEASLMFSFEDAPGATSISEDSSFVESAPTTNIMTNLRESSVQESALVMVTSLLHFIAHLLVVMIVAINYFTVYNNTSKYSYFNYNVTDPTDLLKEFINHFTGDYFKLLNCCISIVLGRGDSYELKCPMLMSFLENNSRIGGPNRAVPYSAGIDAFDEKLKILNNLHHVNIAMVAEVEIP